MSIYPDGNTGSITNSNTKQIMDNQQMASYNKIQIDPQTPMISNPQVFTNSIRSDPLPSLLQVPMNPNIQSAPITENNPLIPSSTFPQPQMIPPMNPQNLESYQPYDMHRQPVLANSIIPNRSHVTFLNDTIPRNSPLKSFVNIPYNQTETVIKPNPYQYINKTPHINQQKVDYHNLGSSIIRSVSVSNIQQKTMPLPIQTNTSNYQDSISPSCLAQSHKARIGILEPPRPSTPDPDFQIPEPVYYEDDETGRYGVRCICGKSHRDGLLVQCDKCQFWLHAICNCIARETKDEHFFCPFCRRRAIRCKCGHSLSYDIPIVQCAQCKYWVHKRCEHLGFGVIPTTFICSYCGGNEFTLPLIKPVFKFNNKVSFVDCDRYELIQSIPDGQFRNFVIADLNRSELHLHETVGRYFQTFAIPIFQKTHEFWKVFIDTLVTILNCDKIDILRTIDAFANTFLYSKTIKTHIFAKPVTFSMSESIIPIVEGMLSSFPIIENETRKTLYKAPNGSVLIEEACEDDEFICELPGFLVHTDEISADDGIPLNTIRIFNTDLTIDMNGSNFQFAPNISRSFHFNCYARIYLTKAKEGDPANVFENVRVGLFATKLKGPLQDVRKCVPVSANSELFLPLDGDLPYTLPKCEWKVPRAKPKNAKPNSRSKAQQRKNDPSQKMEPSIVLSLLTSFCEDIIPPMPITLVNEKETTNKSTSKSRRTNKKSNDS